MEFVLTARMLCFVVHLALVADLPPEYGVAVWEAAQAEGLDEYDLAATLISEKSGPDKDFSFFHSLAKPYTYKWEPDAEGSGSERGLFQLKPNWAWHMNGNRDTEWKKDDLWDPFVNIQVGAYVVTTNQESHGKKCEHRRYDRHHWVAHWKCGRDNREQVTGKCRDAQRKWEKIRTTLGYAFSPGHKGLKAIGSAHNERYRKEQRRAERDYKRQQRRARRKARRAARKSGAHDTT